MNEIMKLQYIIIICPMYAPNGLICEMCNLKKVKVKPSLCPSTEQHATKEHWGVEAQLHSPTSAIDEVSGQPHIPATPPPWQSPPAPIEGWAGPRAGLDMVVKRKILSPRQDSNPRTLIVQPAALVKYGAKVWTGFIWLRIRTSGGLLWTR